ncbi:retrotransposable element [Pelomyxa schiedti]|nr:retrotransposable element [Pelomyxa schiedti]
MRFCIDYRALNSVTTKMAYPMPRIDEMLDNLGGNTLFTGLDLKSGYWQVDLTDDAKAKSAFRTRSGLYQFQVMPFGLVNVVLAGFMPLHAMVYIDDVVIFSRGSFEDHMGWVDKILTAIENAGLQINLSKCQFAKKELKYLGHIVNQEGVRPDPGKKGK